MTRLSLLPVRAALSLAPILVPAAAPAQTRPAAVATSAQTARQGLRARPVEFTVRAPAPEGLPSGVLPFHEAGAGGYEIEYLVRAAGLSALHADTLRIASATAGGADVSKDADGNPSWSVDRFPRIADDGSALVFTLRIAPGRGRLKAALPVVHGSVEVDRAEGVDTRTAPLSLAPGSSARLGPLTVSVEEPKKSGAASAGAPAAAFDGDADGGDGAEGGDAAAAFAALAAAAGKGGGNAPANEEAAAAMAAELFGGMFGGMLGGGDDGEELRLRISGPLDALDSLALVAGGEELRPGMRMQFSPTSAVWCFSAPEGSSVQVKAGIRRGLRRETVSF